jgi:hypothetical protein
MAIAAFMVFRFIEGSVYQNIIGFVVSGVSSEGNMDVDQNPSTIPVLNAPESKRKLKNVFSNHETETSFLYH